MGPESRRHFESDDGYGGANKSLQRILREINVKRGRSPDYNVFGLGPGVPSTKFLRKLVAMRSLKNRPAGRKGLAP
jgi:hypothetical protein